MGITWGLGAAWDTRRGGILQPCSFMAWGRLPKGLSPLPWSAARQPSQLAAIRSVLRAVIRGSIGAVTSSECFGDGHRNAGLGSLLPPKAGEQVCRGTSLCLSSFLPGSASFPILSVPPTRITPHCTPLSPSWASNHESNPILSGVNQGVKTEP